ncbi:MAG: DEAD/DEAH box helicase [Planctomycetota bacterium]
MNQTFEALHLMEPILRALRERGYETPTPVQAQAIPHLLKGRDLLGIAQTGTGKTAAFSLPILDFLAGDPQPRRPGKPSALVLTPTRELAAQIGASFGDYGRHVDVRHAVIFGGVGQGPQQSALRRGVDVLVATPGRLIDLIEQGHVDLGAVEVFVLDEADRMLDMGFVHAVRKVLGKLPRERQNVLFSATMPKDIVRLAGSILRDPVRVEVTPPATTVDRIAQSVLHVDKKDKPSLLAEVLRDPALERVLVFTRTKHGANKVVKHLRQLDESADAIHGNKSQGARERALEGFRTGRVKVLVATDIAARGIDVRGITHVINFDLPNVPEAYVHRIGRTARAGCDGTAISFCAADERVHLRAIEREIRTAVPVVAGHAYEGKAIRAVTVAPRERAAAGSGRGRAGGRRRGARKRPAASA